MTDTNHHPSPTPNFSTRREPGGADKPIDAKLSPYDMSVFNAQVKLRRTTPERLLGNIIHEWVTHQKQSPEPFQLPPAALQLPLETSVLYENESLQEYRDRVILTLANAVQVSEGNVSRAARRLKHDRIAFYKLVRRLIGRLKDRKQAKLETVQQQKTKANSTSVSVT